MTPETRLNVIKVLYVAVVIPLNIIAFIKFKSMAALAGIFVMFGFAFIWLWQWERRLRMRADFMNLAEIIPRLEGEEREKAYARLIELAGAGVAPVHYIAEVFEKYQHRDEQKAKNDNLTPEQKQIIINLRANKEVFYPPESPDIQRLIELEWLIPTEKRGEYRVSKKIL